MSIRQRGKSDDSVEQKRDEEQKGASPAGDGTSNAQAAAHAQKMRVIRAAGAKKEEVRAADVVGAQGALRGKDKDIETTVRLPLSALAPTVAAELESLVSSVVATTPQDDYYHRVGDPDTLSAWLDMLRTYVRSALPALLAQQGIDAASLARAELELITRELLAALRSFLLELLRAPEQERRDTSMIYGGRVAGGGDGVGAVVVRRTHSAFDFSEQGGVLELCLRFSSS